MPSKLRYFLYIFLFCSLGLGAQTGTLTGLITDAEDGSGLPGASIYVKGNTAVGTITELEGTFRLLNVPVGEQTFIISYLGFETQERTVTISAGQTTDIDVKLGGQVITGEVVTISAQALGQAKAINQQLNSDGVANFVSADKIKELPDVNAAEAISRLPGVAINRNGGEGSKIVVRGLDPKFTSININGTRLPSTSGNDRSVDLALISPELLSGIELFKSPTPDMDGDALGGTVNLNIIKADDRPRASLKATGGYNDIVQQFRDYRLTGSLSRRVLNNKLGIIATANVERFNRSARVVGGSWGDNGVFIDTFLNIQQQWANGLNFRHTDEIRRRYNGSLGLDYTFGQKTDVTVLGIYSRTTRDQFTHREGYGAEGGMSATPGIVENSIDLVNLHMDDTRYKVDDFARDLAVSRALLFTKMKSITDHTPNSFIKMLRMKRAAQLLGTGELNVAEVAGRVGYRDVKYFSKSFRVAYGCPPSAYRESTDTAKATGN